MSQSPFELAGPRLEWSVEPRHLDADLIGKVLRTSNREQAGARHWIVLAVGIALLVGVIALDPSAALPILLPGVIVIAGLVVLIRLQIGKAARAAIAQVTEEGGYFFAADPAGTELRSAVAAERLAWPVYQRATTVDDAVVLRTQSRVIRVLPGASMRSGVSPEQAAEVINGWIDSARPGH